LSLGWIATLDREGRTIWIADAHRGDGKRFIVRADEKTTAFIELKSVIRKGVDTLSRSGKVPLALSLLGVAPAVFLTLFPQG